MGTQNIYSQSSKKRTFNYYGMTKDASLRPQTDSCTEQARQLESDDVNEEAMQGAVSSPSEDNWAENKVATSLDDES